MKKILIDDRIALAFEGDGNVEPLEDGFLLKKVKVSTNDAGKSAVSIKHEGMFYNAESGARSPITNTVDVQAQIHPDFQRVLNRLAPHLAVINEYAKETKDFKEAVLKGELDGTAYESFKVGSIIFSGVPDEESYGVQLFGSKKLKNGGLVNFGTPLVKFSVSVSNYINSTLLQVAIEDLQDEVMLFLGGKQKPSEQLALAVA